ncbi:alpha-L-rhamnosidase [Persicimonas caeni]|uniref:alpha-L-rhamnosidase n=1 Tax=Persicimonas caeni TaxID=2292766 RepID=A0A4Y6PPL7_PERCE|nr:glycoside hydrolase family 78 protein [Persicimonas caeni]QDG49715.1 alpha-L-rhamnosidase [Persicimonas caeni]QED30936.1 Bacterial alpha-L-rhamnosidase [Persicimonas caeni]
MPEHTPPVHVTHLRCEHLENPLGLDVARPRLRWQLQSTGQGVHGSAYQVRVAHRAADLDGGDVLWDSGRVESLDEIEATYAGPRLQSRRRYHWSVRVWDQNGQASERAAPAWFEMGLLHPEEWTASLIEPDRDVSPEQRAEAPMLRRSFVLTGDVRRARLYVTAHGLYEARLNGNRVGDELFTPGWTSYDDCLQYQCYDVTDLLQKGDNVLGAILGDGWYRGSISYINARHVYGDRLGLLAQLEVTYDDGRTETIATDRQWRWSTGAIRASDIFDGEHYDARARQVGWDCAGFDDRDWQEVRTGSIDPTVLTAPRSAPVRAIEELEPVEILHTPAGETVFDFGQNMVGWARLRAKGPAGTAVKLQFGEVLDPDGNFYNRNLRTAEATDTFVLAGTGDVEEFEPHFTFHGFRYVKVEGLVEPPSLGHLTGIVVHSDLEFTGHFRCSDERVNQLFDNIVWSQRDNFLDVPTDCPQRDERMGWTGDIQVFAPTACFNMDVSAFLTRWLRDLRVDQHADGLVPMVVPDAFADRRDMLRRVVRNALDRRPGDEKGLFDEYFALFHLNGSVGWGEAAIVVPWTLYQFYGDTRILEESFDSMRALFELRLSRTGRPTDIIWFLDRAHRKETWRHLRYFTSDQFGFGDWLAPGDGMNGSILRSRRYIPTAYLAYSALLLSRMAEALGRTEEAAEYREHHRRAAEAFCYFFYEGNGRLTPHRQTTYVLALAFELLPDEERDAAAATLAELVEASDYEVRTGFLGTPHLCDVLSAHGNSEHAYRLLLNPDHQWLLQVSHGATTIWEHWDNIQPDGSFRSERMLSFNHFAPGAVGAWLYGWVAGIQPDWRAPGFRRFTLAPKPCEGLTHAEASYDSVRGRIASSWTVDGDVLRLTVEIPPTAEATLVIPEAFRGKVTINNEPAQDGPARIKLSSGTYDLACHRTPKSLNPQTPKPPNPSLYRT